jgi:hypothetical protein
LISERSSNPATDQVNWDDVIPSESDVDFAHSMDAQIQFLKDHYPMLMQIRTVTAIFHISHRTYYKMFPTQRESNPSSRFCGLTPKPGRSPIVPPDLERMLIDMILVHQQIFDCPSPRECRAWLSGQLPTDRRTADIDRFWWH